MLKSVTNVPSLVLTNVQFYHVRSRMHSAQILPKVGQIGTKLGKCGEFFR